MEARGIALSVAKSRAPSDQGSRWSGPNRLRETCRNTKHSMSLYTFQNVSASHLQEPHAGGQQSCGVHVAIIAPFKGCKIIKRWIKDNWFTENTVIVTFMIVITVTRLMMLPIGFRFLLHFLSSFYMIFSGFVHVCIIVRALSEFWMRLHRLHMKGNVNNFLNEFFFMILFPIHISPYRTSHASHSTSYSELGWFHRRFSVHPRLHTN